MTPDRLRFLQDLDSNFSVQAAAGTGKTTALVARIARIAQERPEALGKLVVVTYTHRAADEMRQRLRDSLLKLAPGSEGGLLWQGLSRLFIGTIHGFCLRLIGEYGLWLGYGTAIRAASEDDPELERDFERSRKTSESKAPAWLARVHRVIPARDISAMAHQLRGRTVDWSALAENFEADDDVLASLRLDPAALEGIGSSNPKARDAIARWRRHWEELAARWNTDDGRFVRVPLYDGTGGKELAQRWPESLVPWADPLLRAALRAAIDEAAAFQEFRLRSGRLYFSDQIVLAHRLLKNSDLRARLLAQDFHLLLDEAQDTDPLQFELLAELSRPPESRPFAWPRDPEAEGPRPGRFIMVGDAQQAIYRDRATIGVYRRYHEALGAQDPAQGGILTFAETFRCRPAVAAFVNHRFANILTGTAGQAAFVPLRAAAEDDPGRVVRWTRPPSVGSNDQKRYREAQWLAQRLRELGPSGLRARSWDEVAILSPAREWLNAFHHALKAAGIPSLLHFDRPQAHQPEYLWFTALLTLHVEPNNQFEIAGVLRELYGISDDAIYRYRHPEGTETPRPLRLAAFPGSSDPIERLLDGWQQCRTEAETLPLADAVALWIARTSLRERLAALPATGAAGGRSGAAQGLDRLLLQAHAAQLEGKNLREFQRGLLLGIDRPGTDLHEPGEPRIQLMTMKKAKGLQWDAVILPFLGHVNLQGGKADYPKIVCPVGIGSGLGMAEKSEELPIEIALASAFHSHDFPARREEDEEENLRERGRLFYVACTRARYTLVLVDDAKVWERETKQGARLSSPNGYEALRGPSEEAAPEAEGTFVNPLDLSRAYLSGDLPLSEIAIPDQTPHPAKADRWPAPVDLGPVAHRGKKLPSRHGEEEETAAASARALSLQPRRTWIELGANESLAYGVWWHEALRRWPWQAEGKALSQFIASAMLELPDGPQRERGKRELDAFRQSAVCRQLAALPASRRLQEIPYTRPLGDAAVEDGQIDLLYQEENGDWVLLDWKTDALDPADYQIRLREKYGSQLTAYREAVSAFGLPVKRCRIYSTVLGADVILS